jgi:hypothetical protein
MEQGQTQTQGTTDIGPAFHLMWDAFPTVVMLIRKDRTIVDVNRLGRDLGVTPGVKCFQLTGECKVHENCLANQALAEGTAKRGVGYVSALQGVYDAYWLPVPGRDDLYVHLSVDVSEFADPERFPELRDRK